MHAFHFDGHLPPGYFDEQSSPLLSANRYEIVNTRSLLAAPAVVAALASAACGATPAHHVAKRPATRRCTVGYRSLGNRQLAYAAAVRRYAVARVAVGSPATPTPTGAYYVDQRLIPKDPHGPYGPAAVGVSAFSNVLTGWTRGGPIGIHGTDEPWSIGHNVSNGCIRLPNPLVRRLFKLTLSGTPVIIHA